jgi:hypothetical protein
MLPTKRRQPWFNSCIDACHGGCEPCNRSICWETAPMTAIRCVASFRTRDGSCSVHTDVAESIGLTMAEECDAMQDAGLWKGRSVGCTTIDDWSHAGSITRISSMASSNSLVPSSASAGYETGSTVLGIGSSRLTLSYSSTIPYDVWLRRSRADLFKLYDN